MGTENEAWEDDDFIFVKEICPECGAEMELATIQCTQRYDGKWVIIHEWECPECCEVVVTEEEDE